MDCIEDFSFQCREILTKDLFCWKDVILGFWCFCAVFFLFLFDLLNFLQVFDRKTDFPRRGRVSDVDDSSLSLSIFNRQIVIFPAPNS